MSWEDLEGDNLSPEEKQEKAKKINAEKMQQASDLAKLYNRCFTTDDGIKVMAHLTNMFVFNNTTPLDADNPEYECGYHSGEANIIHFIINQIKKATII